MAVGDRQIVGDGQSGGRSIHLGRRVAVIDGEVVEGDRAVNHLGRGAVEGDGVAAVGEGAVVGEVPGNGHIVGQLVGGPAGDGHVTVDVGVGAEVAVGDRQIVGDGQSGGRSIHLGRRVAVIDGEVVEGDRAVNHLGRGAVEGDGVAAVGEGAVVGEVPGNGHVVGQFVGGPAGDGNVTVDVGVGTEVAVGDGQVVGDGQSGGRSVHLGRRVAVVDREVVEGDRAVDHLGCGAIEGDGVAAVGEGAVVGEVSGNGHIVGQLQSSPAGYFHVVVVRCTGECAVLDIQEVVHDDRGARGIYSPAVITGVDRQVSEGGGAADGLVKVADHDVVQPVVAPFKMEPHRVPQGRLLGVGRP